MELIVEQKPVFRETVGEKGDGSLIALKIALQAIDPNVVVFSPGSLSKTAGCLSKTTYVTEKPLSTARMLSKKYTVRGKETKILVISGDISTERNLSEFEKVDENIVYVCVNNAGSLSQNTRKSVESQITPLISASYAATASIALPEDYMKKLVRAKDTEGFSFVEVHCPSPQLWGYEPSNTIIIGRTAVACYIWPLYEIIDKKLKPTHSPEIMEPIDRYINLQKRFTEMDIETLRKRAQKNLRMVPLASREI